MKRPRRINGATDRFARVVMVFTFAVCCLCLLFISAGPVLAQDASSIEALQNQIKALQEQNQKQIKALQEQVDALKAEQAKQAEEAAKAQAAQAAAPAPAEAGAGKTVFANTAVKVTLGGYLQMTGIYRNMYTGSDSNSKWNIGSGGVPLPNSPNYYMEELRGSARATRLSLLAQGQDDFQAVSGYVEADFLGGAATSSANSQSTNGYYPRLRQAWAAYDTTSGWHLLAGQAFSLVTMDSSGIVPRQELLPMVVDNTYVPGFTYTRNPQVRLVKTFDDGVSVGMSLESPQAIVTAGGLSTTAPAGASNYSGALLGPGNAFYDVSATNNTNFPSSLSLDEFPDVAAKVAFDPGWGHYEAYGLARFFTDRTIIAGQHNSNDTTEGWGLGAGVLLPVAPKFIDFMASFLGGYGIGRYGAAGMYDAVVNPVTGQLDPIREIQALTGVVVHATSLLDLYTYVGTEKESRRDIYYYKGTTGGFGAPAYAPYGINIEGGSSSTAAAGGSLAQASGVSQLVFGGWYSIYKGKYGLMNVGISDAYTRVAIFGLGNLTTLNTIMAAIRYYPF